MTTSFIYLNLAASVVATMCSVDLSIGALVFCVAWMGVSSYIAHRAGLLDD